MGLKLDQKVIPPEENFIASRRLLFCFAKLNNQWSSSQVVSEYYKRYNFISHTKKPAGAVRAAISLWNQQCCKDFVTHTKEDGDGCITEGPHRICSRQTCETDFRGGQKWHQYRVEPNFAKIVFLPDKLPDADDGEGLQHHENEEEAEDEDDDDDEPLGNLAERRDFLKELRARHTGPNKPNSRTRFEKKIKLDQQPHELFHMLPPVTYINGQPATTVTINGVPHAIPVGPHQIAYFGVPQTGVPPAGAGISTPASPMGIMLPHSPSHMPSPIAYMGTGETSIASGQPEASGTFEAGESIRTGPTSPSDAAADVNNKIALSQEQRPADVASDTSNVNNNSAGNQESDLVEAAIPSPRSDISTEPEPAHPLSSDNAVEVIPDLSSAEQPPQPEANSPGEGIMAHVVVESTEPDLQQQEVPAPAPPQSPAVQPAPQSESEAMVESAEAEMDTSATPAEDPVTPSKRTRTPSKRKIESIQDAESATDPNAHAPTATFTQPPPKKLKSWITKSHPLPSAAVATSVASNNDASVDAPVSPVAATSKKTPKQKTVTTAQPERRSTRTPKPRQMLFPETRTPRTTPAHNGSTEDSPSKSSTSQASANDNGSTENIDTPSIKADPHAPPPLDFASTHFQSAMQGYARTLLHLHGNDTEEAYTHGSIFLERTWKKLWSLEYPPIMSMSGFHEDGLGERKL
ncbi:hypothetical protein BC832DRAFT_591323 [Gaertneriomyces semiglobifer]|nr:hypothetical protein BC832DRAFT_591323 [Gaertneriomyces semiglobifer]